MFCQLDVLRHSLPPSIRRILDELPESLDETYERILKGIRGPGQRLAHRLLQCLVAAVRPLRLDELAEVLAFDFDAVDAEGIPKINPDWRHRQEDREEAIMSTCSNLVTIVKDGDWDWRGIVQFSHFSVKEYLTSDRLAESTRDVSRYHIRLVAAHTILVRACFGVLLQPKDRPTIKESPLARYAAEHWVTHARFEDVSSRIKDAIKCLFDADKPHFASWFTLLPLDQRLQSTTRKVDRPLFHVAYLGFPDAVEHIVSEHPERINTKGLFDRTPLHAAAYNGRPEIVSSLLKHGADVEARDVRGRTPLFLAAMEGKLEAGRSLLDSGADINPRAWRNLTPVCTAIFNGHVEFVRMLLERGAAMDIREETSTRGWFTGIPLIEAVKSKNIQMVRLLLEHGEDVNECDRKGKSPSQWASSHGRQEILELLSEYGAKSVE